MAVFEKYGAWYCKYPISRVGKRIRYKVEKVGYSKKLADRFYAKKYEEYKERLLLGIEYCEKREWTFGELVDWYLDLEIVKARKTHEDIRRIARLLKERFGDRLASQIKPSDVENYQVQRRKENTRRGSRPIKQKVSSGAVNREVAIMKRIFNLAMREELVERNPCWKVSMLKERSRDRVISHDAFERLVSSLPEHAADVVKVAYYTGMRLGEITSLTWKQVNLQERCLQLEETKNGEPRRVYLFHPAVMEVFVRRSKVRSIAHDLVFSYKNLPLAKLRSSFHRACRLAGIDDFRFHDLRHCFVTNMRTAGVDNETTMKMAGHKTLSMHWIYNSVTKEDAREANSKLGAYLASSTIVPPEGLNPEIPLTRDSVSVSSS
jgi:integrase